MGKVATEKAAQKLNEQRRVALGEYETAARDKAKELLRLASSIFEPALGQLSSAYADDSGSLVDYYRRFKINKLIIQSLAGEDPTPVFNGFMVKTGARNPEAYPVYSVNTGQPSSVLVFPVQTVDSAIELRQVRHHEGCPVSGLYVVQSDGYGFPRLPAQEEFMIVSSFPFVERGTLARQHCPDPYRPSFTILRNDYLLLPSLQKKEPIDNPYIRAVRCLEPAWLGSATAEEVTQAQSTLPGEVYDLWQHAIRNTYLGVGIPS